MPNEETWYGIVEYSALRNRETRGSAVFETRIAAQAVADVLNRKNPFLRYYIEEEIRNAS